MGQLVNNGGYIIKNPVFVTVTWNTDPDQAKLDEFGDKLGATKYWTDMVGEFGGGAGSSGTANHVHITAAPPTQIDSNDLENYLQQQITNHATNGWPAPSSDTIYIAYTHPSTQLMFGNTGVCDAGVGGYHSNFTVAGKEVAFAIVPRCKTGS